MQTSELLNEFLINYEPSDEFKSLINELNQKIIEELKFFISLHYDDNIGYLINNLSNNDKLFLFESKISIFFKTKTINSIINETIEDEEDYENKILTYLEKVKLGESGKGVATKDILLNIGGNASSLRNKLISLEQRKLVAGIGKTISKTWVIYGLMLDAKKKEKKDLGIK
jgi:hypothetical protein